MAPSVDTPTWLGASHKATPPLDEELEAVNEGIIRLPRDEPSHH